MQTLLDVPESVCADCARIAGKPQHRNPRITPSEGRCDLCCQPKRVVPASEYGGFSALELEMVGQMLGREA